MTQAFNLSNSIITPTSQTLDDTEEQQLAKLVNQLRQKQAGNLINERYYNQKTYIKDLGISLPPQFRSMESVLGWPAKTVDVLADRIEFQGYKTPGSSETWGLDQIIYENDFLNEFSQAVTSALTHSVAFITISRGQDNIEPDILWLTRTAYQATGIWNPRTRALDAGLTVNKQTPDGKISQATLWLKSKFVELEFKPTGKLATTTHPNPTGHVLMEPLTYGADLTRPFGRSRITPSVKTLTDAAIRTIVRSEVGAEFYATPQRYILGVEDGALQDKWSALVSRVLAISKDQDGDTPQLGQFTQLSMQPHTDQLRQWAALLAAESSIPLDELGFPKDNPASDAAIQSQRDPLRLRAKAANKSFTRTLTKLAAKTLTLRDGNTPPDMHKLTPWFAPTHHTTDAQAADAALKQVQIMPWLAQSPVILEKLGYNQETINRLLADKTRAEGINLIDQLINTKTQ